MLLILFIPCILYTHYKLYPLPTLILTIKDQEDEINSDLDSSGDSSNEDQEVDHLLLCQYEKVTRIKNKWKIVLRDGMCNINGKDFLFSKASGDFEW